MAREETRRQFFARGARGSGRLRSPRSGVDARRADNSAKAIGRLARAAALRAEGQARHLSAHGRRAAADGSYDYKPKMKEWYDKDLPESIRQGQRLTTMTSGQTRFPIAPSIFKFAQHGQSGAWISELLPYTAKMADDIAIIRSHAHRGDQSRAGDHVHPDRQS